MIRTAEQRRRISEGIKRAYREGKMLHAKKQSPEFIEKRVSKLRGRPQPQWLKEKRAKAVSAAWKRGAYKESSLKNLEKARAACPNPGKTPEYMRQISKLVDRDKLRIANREKLLRQMKEWEKSGRIKEYRERQKLALTGTQGWGINKRGSLEHTQAKFWRVRDPYGRIFEFINCREWVRNNIDRFEDDRPDSKLPFCYRVAAGLKNIHHPREPNGATHYKGWTVVALMEKECDLLGRSP